MNIVALVIATAIPLIFLYVIYALDLYKVGTFRFVLLCSVWGAIAFGLAYYWNRTLYFSHWVSRDNIIRYTAPVAEEILKGLILLYLVRKPNFTYFVDGAIFGFSAGIGFAVFENYQYVLGAPGAALGVAISRVLSTNLIHATASALIGIALGMARFRRAAGHLGLLVAGGLTAMALHSLFNNLVSRYTDEMVLIYAAALGFGGALFIAFMIKRGLAEEKRWIEQTLGMADRVTGQEAAAVQKLESLEDVLAPLVKIFGQDKADQIEQFLVMQARLGILRKSLEKLSDERMKKAVERQMADLRAEMDKARRAVGAYTMLGLRNIFPEQASPLWGRLESLIQERAAARPASGGPNLWATLGQRTTQAAKPTASNSTQSSEEI